jgi:hypothetical protein
MLRGIYSKNPELQKLSAILLEQNISTWEKPLPDVPVEFIHIHASLSLSPQAYGCFAVGCLACRPTLI